MKDKNPHINEWYASDPVIIDHLLEFEERNLRKGGAIWENACGDGVLVKQLRTHDIESVGTDLINRTPHLDIRGGPYYKKVDFLKHPNWYEDKFEHPPKIILTNPPFSKAEDWIYTSLDYLHPRGKLYLFLKTVFLESRIRYPLFTKNIRSLKYMYIFPQRMQNYKGGKEEYFKNLKKKGKKNTGSKVSYAWFVWDKTYQGNPSIKWFNHDYTPEQQSLDEYF